MLYIVHWLDGKVLNSNPTFHENPSSGSSSCSTRTNGQTDRHDEANVRIPQFCERA